MRVYYPKNSNMGGDTMQQLMMDVSLDGPARRDVAIARVAAAAPGDWMEAAREVVDRLASTGRQFTTDDVWLHLGTMDVDVPDEPRAMGAVIRDAAKAGEIVPTHRYVRSTRPECHCRPVMVWQGAMGVMRV